MTVRRSQQATNIPKLRRHFYTVVCRPFFIAANQQPFPGVQYLQILSFSKEQQIMEASQIIDAMRANYTKCSSYEDVGSLKTVTRTRAKERIVIGNFSNIFIRPNLLRFELITREKDVTRRFVIQSDGDSVRSFEEHSVRGTTTFAYDSFASALQTTAGITAGVTNIVFSLMGDINHKYSLLNANQMQRAEDQVIDGQNCFTVEFLIDPTVSIEGTAWIATDSFTLIKFETRTNYTTAFRDSIREYARLFYEAEGIPMKESDETLTDKAVIKFDGVVFNNSTNIDRVISNVF